MATNSSRSAQAATSDPSMGSGYFPAPIGNQNLVLIGPPNPGGLPNPEAMSNVAATCLAVYNDASYRNTTPIPTGASWASDVMSQQFTILPTSTTPSPSANSNQSLGQSGTQQALAALDVEGTQQGRTALNAPNSFSGCLPASATQSYKWQ